MVSRRSPKRARLVAAFGANIRRWRAVNGMSAAELADRAGVTRETLRGIEAGTGTAKLDSVFAVAMALGIGDRLADGVDPYQSDAARARIDDILASGGSL